MSSSSGSTKRVDELNAEELARMERNRQKALLIRHQKTQQLTTSQLYSLEAKHKFGDHLTTGEDTGGGFLVEDDDLNDHKRDERLSDNTSAEDTNQWHQCCECRQEFNKSFLWAKFSAKICDNCKDIKDRHCLVTKTEAKSDYLLSDCDFDRREPPLRYMAKKNPHQFARGDMKLYLRQQVEERALEVWGSEEALEEERARRQCRQNKRKQRQYDKRLKSLRMTVRSSLYTKNIDSHSHEFADEVYVEDRDVFERTCKTCGFLDTFEKM